MPRRYQLGRKEQLPSLWNAYANSIMIPAYYT
jgi:hypothetical protein